MTNETIQGLKRLSWLPDRDASENGTLIAGQEYDNVEFIGGSISGLVLDDVDITNSTINSSTIGAVTPSTGAFTTVSATGQITSTQATGSAPFVVASTTRVSNLNVARAGVADTVTVADAAGDATTFPMLAGSATGDLPPLTDAGLTYDASTNNLTTTTFTGSLNGTATTATNITVANEITDATCFPLFATAATGDLGAKSNAGFTFNSSTATLGATNLTVTTTATIDNIQTSGATGVVLKNSGGTSVLTVGASNTTNSTFAGAVNFGGAASPSSDDGAALGAGAQSWSDIFLASGGLINFANGNSVITHSSGILTVSTGDLRITTAGTNTASVVTVGGSQTLTGKSLTDPLISAGGGALILPQSASPTPTTEGDIRWDTDDNRLVVGDGSGQQIFYPGASGLTLIQTQTVSGVASVAFTGLSSTYSHYILKMANVVPATDATDLWIRTSSNNGSAYDAGASDYAWTRTGNTDAAVTAGAGGDVADAQISIAIGLDNAATASLGGTVELFEPASSARYKKIFAEVSYDRDASTIAMFVTGGKRISATAVNAFQVLMSSGNISGTFTLYGVAK